MISRIIKVDLEVISRSRRLHEADNPQLDHDYSGYRKKRNLIIVFLYIERKKNMVTPISGT